MRRTKKQRVAAWPVGEEAPPHQPRLLAVWQAGSLNRPLMHVGLRRRLVRPPLSPVTSPSNSSATTDSRIFSLNHQRLADQTTVPNSYHQNEFPLPPRCLHRRLLRRLRGSLSRSRSLQKRRRRRRRPGGPRGRRQCRFRWSPFRSQGGCRLRGQEPQECRGRRCRGQWSARRSCACGGYRAGSGSCWVWEFGAGCRLVTSTP